MSSNSFTDKVSFEKWLVNLNEELEMPLELLSSTLRQLTLGETDATRKEQLQIALDLSQRFAGLMYNLNLAALEQTQMTLLRISKIDIKDFLSDMINRFELSLKGINTAIHFHVPSETPEAYVDADRLHKILNTLLSNALHFIKEGGGRIDVTLDAHDKKVFKIIVQDDGIGIVPEKLPHVFNPLYDDDPIHLKLYQSTSAGLYLVLLYARAMGGDIVVESEKMIFTRFTLTLPLITKEEDINYGNFELVSTGIMEQTARDNRLAVTRDFRSQRHSTMGTTTVLALGAENFLTGFESYFDYHVRLMKSSDSALTIARALHLRPNMVILHDADYEGISAGQVAKTLKSHDITQKIPMVWISDRQKLPESDLHLPANMPIREVFEKISELINLRNKLLKEFMDDKEKHDSKPRYQNNKEAFLTRLERIVDAHISRNDLDMDKLSEMLFLNRSQIHRKIKTYTGMNTTEYIRNYKLRLAYRDLENQSGTIAEVAYRNGFNSPSYFTKSFKAVFGISPSAVLMGDAKMAHEN